ECQGSPKRPKALEGQTRRACHGTLTMSSDRRTSSQNPRCDSLSKWLIDKGFLLSGEGTSPRAASPLPPSDSRRGAHPTVRQSRSRGCPEGFAALAVLMPFRGRYRRKAS